MRRCGRRRRRQLRRVDVAVDRLALLADAAVVIDAEVAADADQPRLEVGAAVERVERLVQLEEDVLRQIFGLIVAADELVGDVEHLAPVQADDRFPRRLIAVQAALDELVDRRAAARMTRQRTCRRGADECGADGGNARMITCETLVHPPFQPAAQRPRSATASASPPSSSASARPSTSTARGRSARRTARIDARLRRLSARDPLRAESQLDARDRAPAAVARQPRRRQLRRRDPGGAARRLRAGATSSSPASARRATSSNTPIAAGVGTINAESAGRARSHRGDRRGARAAQARVALRVNPDIDARSHPEHLHRPAGRTSSASRCRTRARIYRDRRDAPGLRFVGVHVHIGSQITTRRTAAARRRRRWSRWRWSCATTAFRSSMSISAAGSASPTKGGR